MPLVAIDERFRAPIPVSLGEQIGLKGGDLRGATVEGGVPRLGPGAAPDRARRAADSAARLAARPPLPEDVGTTGEEISEGIAAARAERRTLGG